VIFALVLAALSMGGQSTTDEPGAVLEIEVAGGEVKAEGPVLLHVTLTNRGSQPLWLNGRLGLNSPFAAPSQRELTLWIAGPDGRQLRFAAFLDQYFAQAKDFCVLRPSESVTATLDLAKYYPFDQEGVYTVRARYADGSPKFPPAPDGVIPFKGPLRSNEVQIHVVR